MMSDFRSTGLWCDYRLVTVHGQQWEARTSTRSEQFRRTVFAGLERTERTLAAENQLFNDCYVHRFHCAESPMAL